MARWHFTGHADWSNITEDTRFLFAHLSFGIHEFIRFYYHNGNARPPTHNGTIREILRLAKTGTTDNRSKRARRMETTISSFLAHL